MLRLRIQHAVTQHSSSATTMADETFPVTLRVYDLSLGMAKTMSMQVTLCLSLSARPALQRASQRTRLGSLSRKLSPTAGRASGAAAASRR